MLHPCRTTPCIKVRTPNKCVAVQQAVVHAVIVIFGRHFSPLKSQGLIANSDDTHGGSRGRKDRIAPTIPIMGRMYEYQY